MLDEWYLCAYDNHMKPTASQAVFNADLDRMNAQLTRLGAVITFEDGWQGLDATKAPAGLLSAYSGLISYGYANGLL